MMTEYTTTNTSKPELLAPAGSVTALKAVIAAGADAVYIGGTRFGARAYAENPEEADLLAAIDYAHLRGVKVYLTVNTLLKEAELMELPAYLAPFYAHGLDAVLVQDFGVLSVIREHFPDLPIHASTQMTVTGPYGARLLKEYGVTRVVPARELSLMELRRIHEESGLEVEAFVHGALCVCYSGRCLLSSVIGGRSGNRGRCAQPCRLAYAGPGGLRGDLISPKDLCSVNQIGAMTRAGIASLKIEGRMKQPAYAAGVVSIYRKYIDAKGPVSAQDYKTLLTLYNRDGFTEGYLTRHNGRDMMAFKRPTLTQKEEQARKMLYEEMNARFVQQEMKIPLSGRAVLSPGRPARVILEDGHVYEGAGVQTADNVPLTADRVRGQLMKTGGTDFVFERLEVSIEGQVFMPVKHLNDLRRTVLEGERARRLAPFLRELPVRPFVDMTNRPRDARRAAAGGDMPVRPFVDMTNRPRDVRRAAAGDDMPSRPSLEISVETQDQLKAAVGADAASRILAPLSLFAGNKAERGQMLANIRSFIKLCLDHGKTPYLSLPLIERPENEAIVGPLYAEAGRLADEGLGGFLVHSLESLARLYFMGLSDLIIAGGSIYTFNAAAQAFVRSLGVREDTVPAELNRKELMGRDNSGSALVIYGREVLMVTAQCLAKNTTGCTGASPLLSLKDRKGMHFPVQCDCAFCLNKIYNTLPLSLLDEEAAVRRLAPAAVRLCFTTEGTAEMERVLAAFREGFIDRVKPSPGIEHTKGHWTRGVE